MTKLKAKAKGLNSGQLVYLGGRSPVEKRKECRSYGLLYTVGREPLLNPFGR